MWSSAVAVVVGVLDCRCFAAGLCLRRFPEQGWNYCKSSPPRFRLWHWAAAFSAAHVLSTVRAEVRVTNNIEPGQSSRPSRVRVCALGLPFFFVLL